MLNGCLSQQVTCILRRVPATGSPSNTKWWEDNGIHSIIGSTSEDTVDCRHN
jgi:hypothetical protein